MSMAAMASPIHEMEAADESGLALDTLTQEQLLHAFRVMHTSRRVDDREILLKRQNKIFFQVSGAGHEAVETAAGMVLRAGHDWFYPYYRDRALCLALGVTAEQMLLQAAGAASDTASGGRQMPSHWSSPELHIVTGSLEERRFAAIYGRGGKIVAVLGMNRPRHVMQYRQLIAAHASLAEALEVSERASG